jgi:hypothetical protein
MLSYMRLLQNPVNADFQSDATALVVSHQRFFGSMVAKHTFLSGRSCKTEVFQLPL